MPQKNFFIDLSVVKLTLFSAKANTPTLEQLWQYANRRTLAECYIIIQAIN